MSTLLKKTGILVGSILLLASASCFAAPPDLEKSFVHPPPSARPWVYWFWLNGNITSNGITADLEAMKRVGLGGVLIMEVDQGAPLGPIAFMSPQWRALFQHVTAEAERLGLEVNMNNDAGWNGSGGPWIRPEQSMQKIVWSETNLSGPVRFEGPLAQPETVAGFYRDITVLAFPTPGSYRIADVQSKAAFRVAHINTITDSNLPPAEVIDRPRLRELSSRMDQNGRLVWDVPDGRWTVMRFGHTSTGVENAPAPASGRGLECDKLSRDGAEANFNGMMARLIADVGPSAGRTLVATHVDSWENGSQNWTTRMREEFEQRRGYDLTPFLPVISGRVVNSLEISERFLWDLRRTISELVIENYAGHLRRLAHAHRLRFTIEAYGSPCDFLPYAGQADEPMAEFWIGGGAMETCKAMASAAHTYGKPILGAEAFTAGDQERWREHPASIKALGDRAFCDGVNRFVFHRYALQPWTDRRPGMTMGPWGIHYERTQTWWEQTPAWHDYLARCQFLLRQGRFVADLCYLQPEAPPMGFHGHNRQGYDWDECTADVVLDRMSVRGGRLVLPDGMSYRALVLPESRRMTPALLGKIKDLVKEGATVIGPPPQKSPSLSSYPQCDDEVRQLAQELWDDCDGQAVRQRAFGQGRVVWGIPPEDFLRQTGTGPDFSSRVRLRYIHRRAENTDLYFVANPDPRAVSATASFRVTGKAPEFWWPDTGHIEPAPLYAEQDGATRVVLSLRPSDSVFVVFRQPSPLPDPAVTVSHDGETLYSAQAEPAVPVRIQKAVYGLPDYPEKTRDVREKVQRKVDAGESRLVVSEMAAGDDPAYGAIKTLVVDYTVGDQRFRVRGQDPDTLLLTAETVNVSVESARYGVLEDPKRTRDVRALVQRILDTGESRFQVARLAAGDDPAFGVVKTLVLEITRDGQRATLTGTDPETIDLVFPDVTPRPADVLASPEGSMLLHAWQSGRYEMKTASGQSRQVIVPPLPPAQELAGPWEVRFAPGGGAPESVTLDQLISWHKHGQAGVKYFSGTATYTTTFQIAPELFSEDRLLRLDLGKVAVMAELGLNGQPLGLLWKPPFQADITRAAKPGANTLEVKVVNLWINRMVGDEWLPEDSERNPNGTLASWPPWLQENRPSPAGRLTFTSWRLWKKDDPLQPSGLLGPVTLSAGQRVPFK